MFGNRPPVNPNVAPVQQPDNTINAVAAKRTVRDLLGLIPDFPSEAADILYGAEYSSPNSGMIPLFASYPFSKTIDGSYVLDYSEIAATVAIYDYYAKQWQVTGQKDNPLNLDENMNNIRDVAFDAPTEQESIQLFKDYINTLILTKQHKLKTDTLIESDSIYQGPKLQKLREDETRRITLDGRRKIPTKGNCRRKGCKSKEVHLEFRVLRSGDEGAVLITVCALCDYTW
jgi:DNA-directed RNA polymerase subunit M/transcription elongation factor TFIIS